MSTATVILSVPGTQETMELPYLDVVAAVARGEIEPTRLVWSPPHQEWKPIIDLPKFHPALRLAGKLEPTEEEKAAKTRKEPRPTFWNRNTDKKKKSRRAKNGEGSGFSIFKLALFLMALSLLGLVGLNYVMIDQPLGMGLAKTPYALTPVHAHLGSFCQVGTLVIHIRPSPKITADNFADFLSVLAKTTPKSPLNRQDFDLVGLTSLWVSQYIIPGPDWEKLGAMDQASDDDRKAFLLEHLQSTNGVPLLDPKQTDPATRTKAWQDLVAAFVPK